MRGFVKRQSCADGAPPVLKLGAEPSAPLRVLDLFSGIGGFALGLEAAGFETVAFCEISPKCRHLLRHHWPEVPIYDDICTLTGERLRADGIAVDAICGGFPCQDISFAGAGAGIAGERSGLWRQYARLIGELRPGVVIVENVAALTSRGLGVVLGDLALLGFDAEWDRIRAADVGAPHLRARLWIVAYARGQQHQGFGDAFRRALAAELSSAAADEGLSDRPDDEADAQRPNPDEFGPHRTSEHVQRGAELRDQQNGEPRSLGEVLAHAGFARLAPSERQAIRRAWWREEGRAASERSWWSAEPDVGRVAHGVPARVDRLHGLGNAVVPEIPYRLGRAILAARAAAWPAPISPASPARAHLHRLEEP